MKTIENVDAADRKIGCFINKTTLLIIHKFINMAIYKDKTRKNEIRFV